MRRVVARTDRVEVVPLHELHRLAHLAGVEHAALDRVEVVAVDSAEPQAASVHEPGVPHDLDAAEPGAHRDGLGRVGDGDLVQARSVGAPGLDGAHVEGVRRVGVRHLGGEAEFGARDPDGVGLRGARHLESEGAVPGRGITVGVHPDVVEAGVRPVQEGHLAEETGQPPLVLVLDVRHRRPLMHAHDKDVLPRPNVGGHVEFLPQPTAAHDADLVAVEPHPAERLQAVEPQPDAAGAEPPRGQVEATPVVAGRVGVRDVGWVERERELHVRVGRTPPAPVAPQHPVGRDVDDIPVGVVVGGVGRRGVRLCGTRVQAEAPVAAQVEVGSGGVKVGAGRDAASGTRGDLLDVGGAGEGGGRHGFLARGRRSQTDARGARRRWSRRGTQPRPRQHAAGDGAGGQPLVAPRVSPATKCFWSAK